MGFGDRGAGEMVRNGLEGKRRKNHMALNEVSWRHEGQGEHGTGREAGRGVVNVLRNRHFGKEMFQNVNNFRKILLSSVW